MLKDGPVTDDGDTYRLENLPDGTWRFHNVEGRMPPDFDFILEPAEQSRLDETCKTLQSDPQSMFRQNLICERLRPNGTHMLLGRALFFFSDAEPTQTILNSAEELRQTLRDVFDLDDPDLLDLWPEVAARHEALFGDSPNAGPDLSHA